MEPDVILRVETDLAALRGNLKQAETIAVKSGGRIQRRLGRALDGLSASAKRLGRSFLRLGPLAAVGAGGALFVMAKRAVEAADAIGKTADKVGLSVEALQELRFAADQSGVATNTLDTSMQRFSRRIGEAVNGTGVLKNDLAALGIQVQDSSGRMRSLDAILGDYAEAVKNADSAQEQLRLTISAFDSEGGAMVNLLRQGSAGIAALREQARQLGIVLDTAMVREAERVNDQLSQMEQIITVNLQRALIGLAPVLVKMAAAFNDAAPAILAFVESFASDKLAGPAELKRRIGELNEEIAEFMSRAGSIGLFGVTLGLSFDAEIAALKTERAALQALVAAAESREALIGAGLTPAKSGNASLPGVDPLAGVDPLSDPAITVAVKDMAREVERVDALAENLGDSFASAFTDAATGARSLGDAIRALETDILSQLTRSLVTQPLANSITSGLGGLFQGAPSFAGGGIVGTVPRLAPSEVPAILHRGETVRTPAQERALRTGGARTVNVGPIIIQTPNPRAFNESRGQIQAMLRDAVAAGARNR